jgi:dimethylargininase
MLVKPKHALVRKIAKAYAPYYNAHGKSVDAELAEKQQAAYIAALRLAGLEVAIAPADERYFDCVFIEDTAVVWQDQLLVTRMTAHREGEQAGVEQILQKTHSARHLPTGSKLEGGDVLHDDKGFTYVGLTDRTNEAGAQALAEFLGPFGRKVISIPCENCLHLKSAVTYIGKGAFLAAPGYVDMNLFHAADVGYTADGEYGAANCLRINDYLLILEGYPATKSILQKIADRQGFHVHPLNMSEFQKGDGSLTCLSLIW